MSATETTLRRSGRERTQTKVYVAPLSSKRKRAESSDEERDSDEQDDPESSSDESEEANDDIIEFPDPQPRKKPTAAKTTRATPGSKPPAAKRPRAVPAGRRRKPSAFDTIAATKDASISDDNALFNALLNSATALESTVQDFLDSYNTTPEAASADVVNCIFRLCGCNASVNSDEVMDSDGVIDFLGDVVEEIKGAETQGYPLISKAPVFRKLRKSLSEFFDRLVKAASESDALFSTDFISTLQSWIVAMSSAQLRSFRHTATVVALEIESALCLVAAAIEKEAETVGRQKDAERKKRKGAGAASEREKTLATKAAEIKGRKTKTNEFLKDFFDGVFVHRYRDADAGIRADCVREMGIWLKRHPAHFLEGNYLRYVGWVLSDTNTVVRLEAVKSLQSLYSKPEYLITIQHFTERFKPRLIAIATSDTDLAVRVAVIHVLRAIDAASLLDEDQRASLCVLIFDEEARVRKAISGFVKGIWEETVEERLVGRDDDDDDEQSSASKLAGAKSLASLLVSWERALLKQSASSLEASSQISEQTSDTPTQQAVAASLSASQQSLKGRTALVVEALWDDVEAVRDWQTLLDILLLDHSGSGASDNNMPSTSKMRGKKSKNAASPVKKSRTKAKSVQSSPPRGADDEDEDVVDEAWRLEEDEEPALVEVLLACLQKTLSEEATRKGGDLDSVQVDTTRALIKVLPQLFAKHQTDSTRMTELLKLPQLMKLDLFLEMRMMTAYETLWEDVTKQILTQTAPTLLNSALSTMSYMLSATLLSNTNNAKLLELDDELAGNLRDAVSGHAELDTATFSSEEVETLTGLTTRLARMAERRDMTAWMEDDNGGKRSSAWDIVSALMERGRLGRKEEEAYINNSITLLSLNVAWRASKLQAAAPSVARHDDPVVELLRKQRDYLVEQLADFVAGGQFNTTNGVKRTAFQSLVTLYVLFGRDPSPQDSTEPSSPLSALVLKMDERLQHQCAGFIQAEAEAFAEEIQDRQADEGTPSRATSGSEQENASSDDDDETPVKATYKKANKFSKGKNRATNGNAQREPLKRDVAADLASEYAFISVISYFLRAITPGAIDPRHASVLLAYHGRLGMQFDHCLNAVIGVLREEGMYKKNGELVEHVVCDSIRQSFTMFMDGQTDSVTPAVGLAKALSPVFVIRGAHLSITQRLASQHIVEIHSTLLTWIVKRIASYEASGNKKKKADSIEFFRVLHALLNTIDSREAVKIKAHLDKALESAKLEVPPTAKAWDAERLYEKRLLGAMAKDKSIVAKGKAIAAELRATDGETDAEMDTLAPKKTTKTRKARPQPTRRSARVANVSGASSGDDDVALSAGDDLDNDDEDGDDDVFGSRNTARPSTSANKSADPPRPKPKPRYKEKTPEPEAGDGTDTATTSSPAATPPPRSPAKIAGRKRARSDEDEDMGAQSARSSSAAVSPAKQRSPQKRQASPAPSDMSEIEFTSTRKRARR